MPCVDFKAWEINGPAQYRLSKMEVCEILGIKEDTLDRQVKEGRFPCGTKGSPGAEPFWTALDIAAWLHIAPKMNVEKEK